MYEISETGKLRDKKQRLERGGDGRRLLLLGTMKIFWCYTVVVAQSCERAKTHQAAHFKIMHFIECEFFKKKKANKKNQHSNKQTSPISQLWAVGLPVKLTGRELFSRVSLLSKGPWSGWEWGQISLPLDSLWREGCSHVPSLWSSS